MGRFRSSVVIAGVVLGWVVPAAGVSAEPTDIGFRGPSYSAAGVSAPTAEKPQSKLWYHDGAWWGSLYSRTSAAYTIWELDGATETWRDTGAIVEPTAASLTDVLFDGTMLYTLSADKATTSYDPIELRRFSYSVATRTYQLDPGFPVAVVGGGTESAVIDKDTTGTLWITYTRSKQVYVAHSTVDDLTWVAPFVLPVSGATNLQDQDQSTVVAHGGRIGVMWSNQIQNAMFFAEHVDGAPSDVWTSNPVITPSPTEWSDDHLSAKAADDGRVFAATKTSLNNSSEPMILLHVLGLDDVWRTYTVATVAERHTRPIVQLDEDDDRVYVFASAGPFSDAGTIYYKSSPMDAIAFAPGLGTPIIQSSLDTHINNAASTKQAAGQESGIVVLAGDDTSKIYLHNRIALGPDLTPPNTTITTAPADQSGPNDATFEFVANEPSATFECSLDGAAWVSCSSPVTYSSLSAGSHSFAVRAIDFVGNVDASPASSAWEVVPVTSFDLVPAMDAFVDEGSPSTNYNASAFIDVDGNAGDARHGLLKFDVSSVSGDVVDARLSVYVTNGTGNGPEVYAIDPSWSETSVTWATRPALVGSPVNDLGSVSSGGWYEFDVTGAVTGGSTIDIGLVPQSSDGMVFDPRESARPPVLHVKVASSGGPDTTIVSGPAEFVNSTAATFEFVSDETSASFECSLDGAVFSVCVSPVSYAGLADGLHTFEVRAVDAAGNVDASPALWSWSVNTVSPETVITAGPAANVNVSDTVLEFSSDDVSASFECSLDGAVFSVCVSPVSYAGLADGLHTFEVRAVDAAGNVDASPAARLWSVDTVSPEAPVIQSPIDGAVLPTDAFTVGGTGESGTVVELFDSGLSVGSATVSGDGTWALSLSAVDDGQHAYTTVATDAAGNVSPSSTIVSITVDTTAPNTQILSSPASPSASSDATFAFASDDAPVTFECSLDGAVYSPCISPTSSTGLADSGHTFVVRAVDAAGNVDETPASVSWTIDTVAPAVSDFVPVDGATGIAPNTNPTVTFSEAMDVVTVSSSSVRLYGPGDLLVSGLVTYDALTKTARFVPGDLLASNTSYRLDVSGATDVAGNAVTPASSTFTTTAAAIRSTFLPLADSYVLQNRSSVNFGTATTLVSDGGNQAAQSIIKFSVDGIGDAVSSARLRVYVTNGTGDGPVVTLSDVSWSESTVTWDTRPTSISAPLADAGVVGTDVYYEFDVSSVITGNGTYSFMLQSGSSDGMMFNSREAGANPPELVVDWSNGGTNVTPPETFLLSAPPDVTSVTTATFEFAASELDATFECSLDGGAWTGCASPFVIDGLDTGEHVFAVRAVGAAGYVDETPEIHRWAVASSAVVVTTPTMDAEVGEWKSSTNFGSSTSLTTDGGSGQSKEVLVRFDVEGITGPVVSARLRVYVTNGTGNGPEVFRTDLGWSESAVTWDTRPSRLGAAIADAGVVPNGAWYEFDVTAAVTADGPYSFLLASISTDALRFDAREGSNPPELVIEQA